MTPLALVDLALVLVALEVAAVAVYRVATGRGPSLLPFIANIVSGLCLMVALRFALSSVGSGAIILAITGSLVAHLIDLAWRWRR
jgi:hypothetical protein